MHSQVSDNGKIVLYEWYVRNNHIHEHSNDVNNDQIKKAKNMMPNQKKSKKINMTTSLMGIFAKYSIEP